MCKETQELLENAIGKAAKRDGVLMAVESELFRSGIYDLEFKSSAHPCRHISSVVAHKELPNGIFCKSR